MKKILLFIIGLVLVFPTHAFAQQYVTESKVTTRVGNPQASLGSFVFYCQGDPQYDDRSSCGLGQAGCGPTSLAMVLSSFGITMTPTQVLKIFKDNGWYSCASFMTTALGSKWLKDLGFTAAPICSSCGTINKDELKKYLDEGYLVIASSQNYPCVSCRSSTRIDHIFVVDGVDIGGGKVSIRDPNNCSYSDGKEISGNISRHNINGVFNWYYAYALKKI